MYTRANEPFAVSNLLSWVLAATVCGHSIYLVVQLGCQDFTRIESAQPKNAPYHVGVKRTKITDKNLQVSIFYPMDRDSTGGNKFTARWFESDPDHLIKMFKHVYSAEFSIIKYFPNFTLRGMTNILLPATKDGRLSRRFSQEGELLRPIIFSHGVSACDSFYSAIHHSMAAHGHLVVALNHQDKSCFYSEDSVGKPLMYEVKELYCSLAYRKAQIAIRTDEVKRVIDALVNDNLEKTWFGDEAPRLDMTQLVLAGHSFGGGTMVKTASELPEPK